ncbi:MAG TPA: CBS domain-containing protein [Planctomycetaceae bacterium]|nr:CBS domain-containing protein [Planctomycetaceae bacterium]
MASDVHARTVRDIMTADVVSIRPHDAVHDALHLLLNKCLSALPVVNHQGRCIGILSVTDLVAMTHELVEELSDPARIQEVLMQWLDKNIKEVQSDRRKVATLMTAEVVSVGPDTMVRDAAETMLKNRVRHLPVVDDDGKLLGIVSTMDLMRAFLDAAGA